MSHAGRSAPFKPANANGPTAEQGEIAINLAGEVLLDLDKEGAARGIAPDLVRESLFFSLIPSLMEDCCRSWSAEALGEAVRRAALSWAELRGEPPRCRPAR
ncbi:MAG: hypothetical protein WCO00_05705 [Rhodospirillaceae bacterium]